MSINPFSYGKPIDEFQRFVGRQREIEQVYSRLLSAFESTSIVGERRIGKTSFLKILAHPTTQQRFGIDNEKYIFIYQDFQFIAENTVPTRFWQRVLRAIKRAVKQHDSIVEEIDNALRAEEIDNYALDDVFTVIDDEDLYIVLQLDEFENVTRNQHFDNDFFGGLRALAIHHNLALVTCSRHDLIELTHSESLRSSPFFNIFATMNLRPFSHEESLRLVSTYLSHTEVAFTPTELDHVFELAGYHPYFLQMTCHHLFATYEQDLDEDTRKHYLIDKVRREASALFRDYWQNSTVAQQILMLVIGLLELDSKSDKITLDGLEQYFNRSDQVLPDLDRRALVVENLSAKTYSLFSSELRYWIADEIVGDASGLRAWRDWQKGETLITNLPTDLQSMLAKLVGDLNPTYQTMLGNWLLEPSTAKRAMQLLGHFVTKYETYQHARPSRHHRAAESEQSAPTPEPPKPITKQPEPARQTETSSPSAPFGMFGRIGQRVAERDREVTAEINISEAATATKPRQPERPPREITTDLNVSQLKSEPATTPPSPPIESSRVSNIRRIGGRRKTPGISPIALGGLIISSIITMLDLDIEDQNFVNGEVKWLFAASDNLLKICRGELDASVPVPVAIPPDAQQLASTTNRLLDAVNDPALLQRWQGQLEVWLKHVDTSLKNLDRLLDREASMGAAASRDLDLQNEIRGLKVEVLQVAERMAQLINQAYGILVTTPKQLVELLEG